jgi:hypothetical protein
MKLAKLGLLLIALFACAGCDKGTPGGPGASTTSAKKFTLPEDSFRLDVPNLTTKLKQGETKTISISVKRAKNFGEDVKLQFTGVPKGVTIDPANPLIKRSEEEAKVTIKADDDAALGDFTVKVIGQPTKGVDATNEFKITIDKK